MGNYITQTDIERRIGQTKLIELTDDAGSGSVDTNNMNACINDAEGEADAYLAKQYSVPLSTVPDVVKAKVLDIVVYELHGRREGATEDVEKRRNASISFFKEVAKGNASLGIDTDPADSPNEGGPQSSKTEDDRTFGDGAFDNS